MVEARLRRQPDIQPESGSMPFYQTPVEESLVDYEPDFGRDSGEE
jgi:hypothetical protein